MATRVRPSAVFSLCVAALVLAGRTVSAEDGALVELAPPDPGGESGQRRGGGGSNVMMDMLDWATRNSDPERVKELMRMYAAENLTVRDIYGHDVYDALFVDEPDIMIKSIWAISNAGNASVDDASLEQALLQLQEVVEQVDNAANLHGMGGLEPLLDFATSSLRSVELRSLALWTIGVAATNNAPVQADLRVLGGLRRLASMLPRCDGDVAAAEGAAEYCGKLLFAISAAVRNDEAVQAEADGLGLFDWLVDVGAPHAQPAVAKKAMGLLDIALAQSPSLAFVDGLARRQDAVGRTIIANLGSAEASADNDRAEKAIRLVNRFLALRPYLFAASFRVELSAAVGAVVARCEAERTGEELEVCEGLAGLARHANMVLAARELADDEL